MTWFKVDDGFWSHPKTISLSDAAVALWVRAGTYSCQHLTDGRIQERLLRVVGGDQESEAELVDAGLWKTVRGGWVFHDWGVYQETKDVVETRREQQRERQRKRRALRDSNGDSNGAVTRDSQRDYQRECATPDPARPDLLTTDVVSSALPRETRRRRPMPIPDDWVPTDTHRAKLGHLPAGIDLAAEADAFRNHALANDRRLVDWNAGFHNWLGKARPRPVPGQGAATTKAQGWLDIVNQLPEDPYEQKAIS